MKEYTIIKKKKQKQIHASVLFCLLELVPKSKKDYFLKSSSFSLFFDIYVNI